MKNNKYTDEIAPFMLDYTAENLMLRLADRGRFDLVMYRPTRPKAEIHTRCTNPLAFSHTEPVDIDSFAPVEVCPFCGHPDFLEVVSNGKA